MNDTDPTAVNPRHGDGPKARVMTPDPMKPHSLYDPDEAPHKTPGPDDQGPILSRK